jgi:hypothetical protein
VHCPACGIPLALALEQRAEGEVPEDELEAVVRHLEAERYANPVGDPPRRER